MMKKTTFVFTLVTILALFSVRVQAQSETPSMKNTVWKAYLDELNDSISLHIGNDSSFVTTSNGDTVVLSVCTMAADTLLLSDYAGQYACVGMTGKYLLSFNNDIMTTVLVTDGCDGRAGSINNLKWRKSQAAAK